MLKSRVLGALLAVLPGLLHASTMDSANSMDNNMPSFDQGSQSGPDLREQVFPSVERQIFQRDRAGQGIGRVGVAVEERFKFFIASEERAEYFFGRERRRERQVSSGETLRDAEEIRRHLFLFAGEE